MTAEQNKKPGRPFGVTLAIGISILMYTIFPLMIVGSVLLVEQHFANAADNADPFGNGDIMSGGDFRGGITNEELAIQAGVALVFLVIAVVTWRGKPPYMRYVFMITVLILAGVAIVTTVLPTQQSTEPTISGGSLDGIGNTLSTMGVIAQGMVVPLYVTWYLNRGPSRAFFRGYYLDRSERGIYADDDPTPQPQAAEVTHS